MTASIHHRLTRTLCVLSLVASLPACTWLAGDSRVFVVSEPPGAEVLVDGEPTGKTTPAILELGGACAADRKISVRKQGFEPEERQVTHYTRFDIARLDDGAVENSWMCPLFWTAGDMLFPLELRWKYVPHTLYVKLFPEGTFAPKPGATLPAEQR